jgi:L-ascorbate metabolism protein UlaG (beta-lactamase superfamily)
MRLTKFGHACVRIEAGGTTIVVDPGAFTEPGAVAGADAILVTHEHVDHFSAERLVGALDADPGLGIWTNGAVAGLLEGPAGRIHVVGHGDTLRIGGIEIEVHGELHAELHEDIPRVHNIGFLFDGALFHPGDAFTDPGRPVDTLMLPIHAPWSRTGQLIDYVRSLRPGQALSVHDAGLSEVGVTTVGNLLGSGGPGLGPSTYRYLEVGATAEVGDP